MLSRSSASQSLRLLRQTAATHRSRPKSRLAWPYLPNRPFSGSSPRQNSRQQHTAVARAASTAGNALLVGSVVTLFGYILYTLYDNLIAEHGTTRVYNESLDLIRANPQIKDLFGSSIIGFGEPSHSQRQRQRHIAHRLFEDPLGRQRLTMQYYIEDSKKAMPPYLGVVKLDLAQSKTTMAWDYNYIVVDLYLKDGNSQCVGRIKVLVTDEFANEVKDFETRRRNHRFSPPSQRSSAPADADAGLVSSWLGVLNPANWRKS
ncbi:mitochondrial import inner membrane translocase subunit tim21 [Coemansia thaxteri]|uniref:Mitochondrial import inner membrane translocase subunit Tim21 n=1 Tax=Coemansia thaxteri TaxID=2663907 RepID=A0A9W8BDG9_9FUNG|nr:mitochondrial import inner membrane translocase subunit tim21 [Coemansia thaxteri]KAJ2480273.1 mitochondrial import inner membrane translocase subunit tim21 [Coemansia sp. RSA 2320]